MNIWADDGWVVIGLIVSSVCLSASIAVVSVLNSDRRRKWEEQQ